jgi:hypothetical protein
MFRSAEHTPLIDFLPHSDPRRALHLRERAVV